MAESVVQSAPAPADNASAQVEIAYWNSIKDADNAAFIRSYLAKYPQGVFADLARLKIAELETETSAPKPSGEGPTAIAGSGSAGSSLTLAKEAADIVDAETKVAALTPSEDQPAEAAGSPPAAVKPNFAAQNYERAKNVGTKRAWQLFVRKHGADRIYGPLALQQLGLASESGNRDARNAEVEDYLSLGRTDRAKIQTALNERGFDVGAADGVFGPKTRSAIRDFQLSSQTSNTGYVDHTLLELLDIDLDSDGSETFVSDKRARIYNPDDLEALGEDRRIIEAIRCLRTASIIYGKAFGKVYLASNNGGYGMFLEQSAKRCGGYLVAINSAAENRFVYDMIHSEPMFFGTKYEPQWGQTYKYGPMIGLVQEPNSREPASGWRWANGDKLTYRRWDRGQPNNSKDASNVMFHIGRNGRRANMDNVRADRWNDTNMAMTGFIMEID